MNAIIDASVKAPDQSTMIDREMSTLLFGCSNLMFTPLKSYPSSSKKSFANASTQTDDSSVELRVATFDLVSSFRSAKMTPMRTRHPRETGYPVQPSTKLVHQNPTESNETCGSSDVTTTPIGFPGRVERCSLAGRTTKPGTCGRNRLLLVEDLSVSRDACSSCVTTASATNSSQADSETQSYTCYYSEEEDQEETEEAASERGSDESSCQSKNEDFTFMSPPSSTRSSDGSLIESTASMGWYYPSLDYKSHSDADEVAGLGQPYEFCDFRIAAELSDNLKVAEHDLENHIVICYDEEAEEEECEANNDNKNSLLKQQASPEEMNRAGLVDSRASGRASGEIHAKQAVDNASAFHPVSIVEKAGPLLQAAINFECRRSVSQLSSEKRNKTVDETNDDGAFQIEAASIVSINMDDSPGASTQSINSCEKPEGHQIGSVRCVSKTGTEKVGGLFSSTLNDILTWTESLQAQQSVLFGAAIDTDFAKFEQSVCADWKKYFKGEKIEDAECLAFFVLELCLYRVQAAQDASFHLLHSEDMSRLEMQKTDTDVDVSIWRERSDHFEACAKTLEDQNRRLLLFRASRAVVQPELSSAEKSGCEDQVNADQVKDLEQENARLYRKVQGLQHELSYQEKELLHIVDVWQSRCEQLEAETAETRTYLAECEATVEELQERLCRQHNSFDAILEQSQKDIEAPQWTSVVDTPPPLRGNSGQSVKESFELIQEYCIRWKFYHVLWRAHSWALPVYRGAIMLDESATFADARLQIQAHAHLANHELAFLFCGELETTLKEDQEDSLAVQDVWLKCTWPYDQFMGGEKPSRIILCPALNP